MKKWFIPAKKWTQDLTKAFIQLAQYTVFVEHFAVVASFIVVRDALSQLSRQLPTYHILLHLLQLQTIRHCITDTFIPYRDWVLIFCNYPFFSSLSGGSRAFIYTWSLSVTWQRWQSHHSICHCRKPHAAQLHGSMFYRTGIISDGSFTLRE